MRIFVLVSTLLLLTSCAAVNKQTTVPQTTFHYAYQNPSRVLTTPGFARQLSSGQTGSHVKIKLQNNTITTVKLGRPYFSASGHNCRRYMVQVRHEYTACQINGRWYEASPIIVGN